MQIHLVDGTYELFRNYYGAPPKTARDGREVGATVALGRTLLGLLLSEGATHVGVAFDPAAARAPAAALYGCDERVERVLICSPDKDLAQCVREDRIVLVDRRRKKTIDGDGGRGEDGACPG